ncbi:hypothetical protein FF38_11367 [Lucilia cuprina]|uniref:Uncharacterized protein n=1 Tax=Lucilia cuprina TaxID=7375 RepID=A0A0L0C317_LUCCU|nr:hypothetical protein FF38_11367 [Lucilia cuprina]
MKFPSWCIAIPGYRVATNTSSITSDVKCLTRTPYNLALRVVSCLQDSCLQDVLAGHLVEVPSGYTSVINGCLSSRKAIFMIMAMELMLKLMKDRETSEKFFGAVTISTGYIDKCCATICAVAKTTEPFQWCGCAGLKRLRNALEWIILNNAIFHDIIRVDTSGMPED